MIKSDMAKLIEITDDGPVRIVRMARPDKKNALTAAMYEDIANALVAARTTPSIRCIVIAGTPGAFCAGNDLEEFRQAAASGEGLGDSVIRFLHALACCERPLVAAVDGLAIGVGTTMLLHCDYVVASRISRFTTPFVGLGLVPEAASSLLAPRLMGPRRAFALLVMGEPLDAERALSIGLVNALADSADVETDALAAARRIAVLPPEAVLASRRLIRGEPEELIERIDLEADFFRERLQSPEAQAAFEAFFARKK
jgi:enoyl-CoA hydratase/carnithine racemase